MDLEACTSIDIGRYRYNYDDFCKKIIYLISINKDRRTTPKGANTKFERNSLLLYLSLSEKIVKEEIQWFDDNVDTTRD